MKHSSVSTTQFLNVKNCYAPLKNQVNYLNKKNTMILKEIVFKVNTRN